MRSPRSTACSISGGGRTIGGSRVIASGTRACRSSRSDDRPSSFEQGGSIMARFIGGFLLLTSVAAVAQDPANPPRPLPPSITQAGFSQPQSGASIKPSPALSQLPPLARHVYLSAQRGCEWLYRSNQPTGRLLPGWGPALDRP